MVLTNNNARLLAYSVIDSSKESISVQSESLHKSMEKVI